MNPTPPELVVLVDADGHAIGTATKATVHHRETPLHLAFSCYIFDGAGRMLLTRRALEKPTWPGAWTNSFCGHPSPGEDIFDAVRRRAREELGIALDQLQLTLPTFRYEATMKNGTRENELCPVFTATTLDEVQPDPSEVSAHEWVDWAAFRDARSRRRPRHLPVGCPPGGRPGRKSDRPRVPDRSHFGAAARRKLSESCAQVAPSPAGASTRLAAADPSPILDAAALHRISSGFTRFSVSAGPRNGFLRAVRRPEGATSAGPRRRNVPLRCSRRSPAALRPAATPKNSAPRRGFRFAPTGAQSMQRHSGGGRMELSADGTARGRRPCPPQAARRASPCPAPRRGRARPVPDTRMAGTIVRAPARGPGSDRAEPAPAAPRRLGRDPGLRASGVRRRGEPGSHPDVRAPSQPGDRLRPDGQAIRPLPKGIQDCPCLDRSWRVWPSSSSC